MSSMWFHDISIKAAIPIFDIDINYRFMHKEVRNYHCSRNGECILTLQLSLVSANNIHYKQSFHRLWKSFPGFPSGRPGLNFLPCVHQKLRYFFSRLKWIWLLHNFRLQVEEFQCSFKSAPRKLPSKNITENLENSNIETIKGYVEPPQHMHL